MVEEKSESHDISSKTPESEEKKGFFAKHGPNIFLAGLVIYLILLTIGIIAEIFDIQSILDWWIWSVPRR